MMGQHALYIWFLFKADMLHLCRRNLEVVDACHCVSAQISFTVTFPEDAELQGCF